MIKVTVGHKFGNKIEKCTFQVSLGHQRSKNIIFILPSTNSSSSQWDLKSSVKTAEISKLSRKIIFDQSNRCTDFFFDALKDFSINPEMSKA